jgi:outer membrane immunogenic protein
VTLGDVLKVLKSALLGATILVGATVAASAADVYERGGSYKDTPAYVPVSTWAGFYAGIHAGSTFDDTSKIEDTNVEGDVDDAFIGGVHVGYNWQRSSPWVFGVEASLSYLDDDDITDYVATFRGRLGYAFDRTLVYGTGGLAILGFNEDIAFAGLNPDDTAVGYVVGGGIDHKISDKVSIGLEALYYSVDAEGENFTNDLERDLWTVQARLNYHLGSRHDEALK